MKDPACTCVAGGRCGWNEVWGGGVCVCGGGGVNIASLLFSVILCYYKGCICYIILYIWNKFPNTAKLSFWDTDCFPCNFSDRGDTGEDTREDTGEDTREDTGEDTRFHMLQPIRKYLEEKSQSETVYSFFKMAAKGDSSSHFNYKLYWSN